MTKAAPPTLYQYTACPFCWKVRTILSYKRVPYKKIEVDPASKKEIAFSKEYKKVPIYMDSEGVQVNDSTSIMQHIDREFPNNSVFEGNSEEQEKWLQWSSDVLVRALPPLIYRDLSTALRTFSHIVSQGNYNWWQRFYTKYAGSIAMRMVARKRAKQLGIDEPTSYFTKLVEQWGNALGERTFLGRETPNGADLAVWGILSSIRDLPEFSLVQGSPKVSAWYQRVRKLVEA